MSPAYPPAATLLLFLFAFATAALQATHPVNFEGAFDSQSAYPDQAGTDSSGLAEGSPGE
jgi:hypothetical protein